MTPTHEQIEAARDAAFKEYGMGVRDVRCKYPNCPRGIIVNDSVSATIEQCAQVAEKYLAGFHPQEIPGAIRALKSESKP